MPGVKTTARKIQKREKIIEVAIHMLKDKEYNEIRIEDISAEFKMAKSMLFYYFDSKAALYLAVLEKLHLDAVEDFREELRKTEISDYNQLRKYIMSVTHKFIQDHFLLIKLMDCEERIYSEAAPQQVKDANKNIGAGYDALLSEILNKSNFFVRNDLFYIFEVQRHFLRGYYRQMISKVRYLYEKDTSDRDFERKSLYEFRVLHMMHFFFDGVVSDNKKVLTNDS